MKKTLQLFFIATSLAIIPLSFSSCEKLKDLSVKDLFADSKDIDFDIPPTAVSSQQQSADVGINVDSLIDKAAKGFSSTNIKSATVSKITLNITSGADVNNNFSNFSEGGVALYSNTAPTKVTVGQILNNPAVYSVQLDVPLVGASDLSAYVKGSVLTYVYGYTVRKATTVPLHVVMHVQYKLGVGL